jgi:hypothetical protein
MDKMIITNPHTNKDKYLVEDGLRVTDLTDEEVEETTTDQEVDPDTTLKGINTHGSK